MLGRILRSLTSCPSRRCYHTILVFPLSLSSAWLSDVKSPLRVHYLFIKPRQDTAFGSR